MKIKFLLICLGIVSLAALGLGAWIYITYQTELTEYAQKQDKLDKQNTYLREKLDDVGKETRHWQEKSASVTTALDKLGKEHTLLLRQCDTLLKDKESLVEQNTTLNGKLENLNKLYIQEKEKSKVDRSDKFLASLLKGQAGKEAKIEELRARISSQKAQLEDVEKQVRPAWERLAQLGKKKETLEKGLMDAQRVSDILSNDLLKEKKKSTVLEKDLAQTEEQLRGMMQERDKLAGQLAKMKMALERRLEELNRTKKVLESAVEGAKKAAHKERPASIQLPPIVVKAEQEVVSAPILEPRRLSKAQVVEEETLELAGRIITVNEQYRFVVIDIGRAEGVEKGMFFDVYRDGKRVGKILVIETRNNIAACDIKEMDIKRLKVDDIVRR